MKPFILTLLTLLVIAQLSYSQVYTCQGLQQYISEPIKQFSLSENGDGWVIAGEACNKIYHIKKMRKSFKVIRLDENIKNVAPIVYTSILYVEKNGLLATTANSYVYFFKNRKVVHLAQASGLMDSVIVSVQNVDSKVIVSSNQATYLFTGYKNRRKPCFQKTVPIVVDTLPFTNFVKNNLQLPIQRAICNVASPVDLSFRAHKYITHKELKKIKEVLRPGDILIRRNDEQLSNIGIPGFWKHAAIYVGSGKLIDQYFDSIPLAKGLKPSDLIKTKNIKVYRKLGWKRFQIIEVVGEGTKFSPVEHIAKSDYFAAFRPNLTKEQIFTGLQNALNCYGLPYDYLFEFKTPNALVCSELVYRSYESDTTFKALNFQMGTYAGEPFLSPNDIVVQFANEYKKPDAQLQLLFFYDADAEGIVTSKSAEELTKSITR